jgi:hypothetical protein
MRERQHPRQADGRDEHMPKLPSLTRLGRRGSAAGVVLQAGRAKELSPREEHEPGTLEARVAVHTPD